MRRLQSVSSAAALPETSVQLGCAEEEEDLFWDEDAKMLLHKGSLRQRSHITVQTTSGAFPGLFLRLTKGQ